MSGQHARRAGRARPRLVRSSVILAGAVVPLLLAGSAGAAPPERVAPAGRPVRCGEVITADTTLRTNLRCRGTALTIAAAGVTLDLDGHTVWGDGTGSGIDARSNQFAVDGLTVRNGTIGGFGAGIELGVSTGVSLGGLRLVGNDGAGQARGGIYLQGTRQAQVSGVEIRDSAVGAYLDTTTDVTLDGLLVEAAGVVLADAFHTTIGSSTFTGAGIVLTPTTSGNEISGNLLTGSTITFDRSGPNVVRGNRIRDADVGVLVRPGSTGNIQILGNSFSGTGIGLLVDDAGAATVAGNAFAGAGAAGALLRLTGVATGPFVISGNTFRGNGFDSGGLVDSAGSAIDDGLHIDVPADSAVLVSDNATADNADHGIEARPGSVQDGGGNTSSGDPNGCLGVACTEP